jgi:hypothetical protein
MRSDTFSQSGRATVVEAPPKMLGFLQDGLQRYLADIGPLGADKGKGSKLLVLPPGYTGSVPKGYFDDAVALMKRTKVYPPNKTSSPPPIFTVVKVRYFKVCTGGD